MDEKQAWESFYNTGSVEAYLHYTRLMEARMGHDVQEDLNADRYRRLGDYGEKRG